MKPHVDDPLDASLRGRLRSLEARTRDVRASRELLVQLDGLMAGPPRRQATLSVAILRFAVPSLVTASLVAGGLLVLDRADDPSLDDDLALAATLEVGP